MLESREAKIVSRRSNAKNGGCGIGSCHKATYPGKVRVGAVVRWPIAA